MIVLFGCIWLRHNLVLLVLCKAIYGYETIQSHYTYKGVNELFHIFYYEIRIK